MTYKRYEYWSREGKVFTPWFRWDSENRDPWQLKNRLRNEYVEDIHKDLLE